METPEIKENADAYRKPGSLSVTDAERYLSTEQFPEPAGRSIINITIRTDQKEGEACCIATEQQSGQT
jgi:hypothetical protein